MEPIPFPIIAATLELPAARPGPTLDALEYAQGMYYRANRHLRLHEAIMAATIPAPADPDDAAQVHAWSVACGTYERAHNVLGSRAILAARRALLIEAGAALFDELRPGIGALIRQMATRPAMTGPIVELLIHWDPTR